MKTIKLISILFSIMATAGTAAWAATTPAPNLTGLDPAFQQKVASIIAEYQQKQALANQELEKSLGALQAQATAIQQLPDKTSPKKSTQLDMLVAQGRQVRRDFHKEMRQLRHEYKGQLNAAIGEQSRAASVRKDVLREQVTALETQPERYQAAEQIHMALKDLKERAANQLDEERGPIVGYRHNGKITVPIYKNERPRS